MKTLIYVFAIVLIFGLPVACVHEVDDLSFEPLRPGISLPLGEISMNANSLTKIGDSLDVRTAESGILEFIYKTEVLNSLLSERFLIEDQVFNDSILIPLFSFSDGKESKAKASEFSTFQATNTDFTDAPPRLTSVVLKRGILTAGQSKDFSHDVQTVVTFPGITKDGIPLTVTIVNSASVLQDLAGYEMALTGPAGDRVNTLHYEITSAITESDSSTQGSLRFDFEMSSMDYTYMQGDLLTYAFDEVDSEFDLNLPQNEVPDNIRFTNPRIIMTVSNSAGVEFSLDVNDIFVVEENGESLSVTGSYREEVTYVDPVSEPGEMQGAEYVVNNDNADNLVELFSDIPESVFFRGLVIANPRGTPPEGNFITDNSRVAVDADLVLPFDGYADHYAIIDTIEVDLIFDDDGVISMDNISLRFQTENSFPFDLDLQAYFLDSTQQQTIIDSLFTDSDENLIMLAGEVDDSGEVTSPTKNIFEVSIAADKYEKIRYAEAILIRASIITSGVNETPKKTVKFTQDNALVIGMGITGNALVDMNKLNTN